MPKVKILVPGCGQSPLRDTEDIQYINIDMVPSDDSVIQHDLTNIPYPLPDESIDCIYFFHTIEHISAPHHPRLLKEFHRLLKPHGRLCISYPEFTKCAENYITNYRGEREFWAATIYGRGTSEWDRHKALMDTKFFIPVLKENGFANLRTSPEVNEPFNTVLVCERASIAPTYAQTMEVAYLNVS